MSDGFLPLFSRKGVLGCGDGFGPVPEFLESASWSSLYQSYIARQVYARLER